jgi:hypothetical protein
MKKFNMATVLLGGLVALALTGCDAPSPSVRNTSVESAAETPQVGKWPPVSQEPVDLAKSLLATTELDLLDNSGSMDSADRCTDGETRFERAKEALANHIKAAPDSVNRALAVFTYGSAQFVVPFGSGPEQKKKILASLKSLRANAGTPLYGALKFSYEELTKQGQKQLGYGTYRLVPITDGESTDYDPGPLAKEIALNSPIEVHTIGFCLNSRHSLDIPGFTKFYAANDPQALAEGLAAVRAEVQTFDPKTFSLE